MGSADRKCREGGVVVQSSESLTLAIPECQLYLTQWKLLFTSGFRNPACHRCPLYLLVPFPRSRHP